MGLFLPAECLLCKRPLEPLNKSFICGICWKNVEWLPALCCVKCAKPLPFTSNDNFDFPQICLACQIDPPHFQRLFSPMIYRDVVAEAIKLFKYNRKRGIIRGFIRIIESYLTRFDLKSLGLEVVVPIPLHFKRLRERGFNQAEDLANVVGNCLNLSVWNNYLTRVRYTRPQTNLKKQERRKNLKNAFSLRKKGKNKGKGKRILLIDDVYTTGATLNEASYEMKKYGAEVFSFTLARTIEL